MWSGIKQKFKSQTVGKIFGRLVTAATSWTLAIGMVIVVLLYGPGILLFHTKIPQARASSLSFVCSNKAAATSAAACTGEQAGDLLVVFAGVTASSTIPTMAGGFTQIDSNSNSGGSASTRTAFNAGWALATGSSSGSGTWTGASQVIMQVYRGQAASPIGNELSAGGNNSATNVNYPAVSLSVTDGSSWFAAFGIRNTAQALMSTAPTGMTNRASTPATPVAAGHDTNGGTASNWSSTNVGTFSASAKFTSIVIEILAAPAITVGATGTQVPTLAQGITSADIGGAFAFIRDIGSANITSIKIHNSGTLDASTYLSNVFLIYSQQTTCSASPPLSGSSQYNLTAGTFNASNDATMAAAASTPVGTSQICWYVEFDVSSSAPIGSTIDIQITDPATDVVANQGSVIPTSAVALSGSTTIVGNGPTTDQLLRGGEFFSGGSKSPFFWAN